MFDTLQRRRSELFKAVETGSLGGRKSASLRAEIQGPLAQPLDSKARGPQPLHSASASASASAEEGGGAGSGPRDELFLDSHTVRSPNGARPARVIGGFEEFWKAWPWKERRPQARAAFQKLNPDRALLDATLVKHGFVVERYGTFQLGWNSVCVARAV